MGPNASLPTQAKFWAHAAAPPCDKRIVLKKDGMLHINEVTQATSAAVVEAVGWNAMVVKSKSGRWIT